MEKLNKSQITRLFSNAYIKYTPFILAGFFLGWLIFRDGHSHHNETTQASEVAQETIWTCSMHPQIRMHEPGDCPICGMDLIPLVQNGSSGIDPDAVRLTKEGAALANVQTTVTSRQKPVKEVRLYGKVTADERMLQSQVSHVSGRIEKLFVNFTGENVRKGQVLAQVYSPELISAQQELLETSRTRETQPAIYEAAREKLRQWKITDEQISAIESSGVTQSLVDVVSSSNGIVISKLVNTGNYIAQGTILYEIADLSGLWVLFDAYEGDLRFLRKGEKLTFTVEALPGEKFTGTIAFIDPVIDPVTRVAKVRVETRNSSGRLKPEMFVTGIVSTTLPEFSNNLVIPKSAVLWTGKRSIVYVRQSGIDEPVFRMREVELGPALGDSYVVVSGLAEGEEIVTNGTFSVDAAAQLAGKPSMMNPAGGAATTGHDHGTMPGTGKESGKMSETDTDHGTMSGSKAKPSASTSHAEFRVEGNCEMCKERIETTAKKVHGVESADWNIETKQLHLTFDKSHTDLDEVKKSIADAGHDNDKYCAPDTIYNSLPECCLYRK
ncbi:efflux RND transporter periplasmic adaptor subunit [bacterium]|nr:efflux RND transporter periplasmic adaptor subunit [bacterium]